MMLLVLVTIPLLAAVGAVSSPRPRLAAGITLAAAITILGLAAQVVLMIVSLPQHMLVLVPDWIALDALGALILLLIATVNVTATIFSMGYMDFNQPRDSQRFYLNFNLFIFSMLSVPLIQEPNMVWIAVELTTLFSVLLVGFENTHAALEAAWKYVVLTLMGAAMALLGFLVLYWAARQAGVQHYTWAGLLAVAPLMSPVLLQAAFVLILVGFGAKIGLVPLHTWLPDAHSQAPAPVCALLSGVETTAVLYVILRLLPVMSASSVIHANTWLLWFGLLSVGTAAFLLLRVSDYKRLFAFSTVEHMGLILVAVGLGGPAAYAAAMLQVIGHSLTKSFCFYAAGSVWLVKGTREITAVRGLIRHSPVTAVALLFAGLAIAGAPPFVLFLSEFSILRAGLQQAEYWVTGLLVLFIAIAFFAIMSPVSRMVFGADEIDAARGKPISVPPSCRITLVLAAIPVLVLGLYIPGVLQQLLTLAAAVMGG